MKIRMKTRSAGPDGIHSVGDIIDIPDKQAKQLVDGGYAEAMEPIAEPKPEPPRKQKTVRK